MSYLDRFQPPRPEDDPLDCPVCGAEGIWWEGDHDTPGFYTCPDWTCAASKVPEPEPAEDENE